MGGLSTFYALDPRRFRNRLISLKNNSMLSFNLLTHIEKIKIVYISIFQILLNLLDIIAVGLMGAIGYLAISGFGVTQESNKINLLLRILNLDSYEPRNQTIILAIMASALFISKSLLTAVVTKKSLDFLSNCAVRISNDFASKYFKRSAGEIIHSGKSDAIYSLSEGIDLLITKALSITILIISDFFLLFLMLIALSVADLKLSIFTVIFFFLITWRMYKKQGKISGYFGYRMRELRNLFQDRIFEFHENFKEIEIRGTKPDYLKTISNLRKEQSNIVANMAFLQVQSKYILESAIVIGGILLSAYQFFSRDAGHAIALLTVFFAAGTRILPSILRLQNSLVQLKNIYAMNNSISNLLNINKLSDKPETWTSDRKSDFEPRLSLNSVNFRYKDNDKFQLENLNLEIEPFTFNAIVGPTGSGKSTLLDLCLGFIEPKNGEVFINGMPPSIATKMYPGAVALVSQRIYLTKSSLRQNLLLGINSDNIKDDELFECLKKVNLLAYVKNLPLGLDSELGEFGSKLSGGQRQRLGIARALITKPKLLFIDEGTSSLDSETEEIIAKYLEEIKPTTTILSIAHRLSTVKKADKVVYLDNGKILSEGTFGEVRGNIPNFDTQARLLGL
jgi:ABC-type multidrug transport system fused ATPase/permease subunit